MKKNRKWFIHVIIILLCIYCVFPVFWMISSSFKVGSEIFNNNLLPITLNLGNYKIALDSLPIIKMLINSVVVSLATGFIQLTVSILFAYAFVRWNFKGKSLIFSLVSLAWLVPIQAIMIPNYIEIVNMGFANTLTGIILPNTISVFANIRMYQAFNSFPRALTDAARLDGANDLQILLDIIIPNLKAMIASLGIVQVIGTWNEYLWPKVIVATHDKSPIQIGLRTFMVAEGEMWGAAMAAASISTIPILIIYIIMSRNIIDSFMKGGIK